MTNRPRTCNTELGNKMCITKVTHITSGMQIRTYY